MTTNQGMKNLIAVINKLQDAYTLGGGNIGLDLPQIAVVGGQSAGKSSVLENFVGKDFLPRGSGIVTRRPLVLQLYHNSDEEYSEFLHCKGKRFYHFDEVRKEIERETDRETGINKGISKLPINLRIYSPYVLDLTLVDLPGLTKVPVGDQPRDIENQIRDMIFEYISQENTLILAVTPANIDLANSDALKLAREVDADGSRTVGVITKLDLMDKGTDARDILENKIFPLKRGYIGVVNRSQQDIDKKKNITDALQAEREFFMKNIDYKHMADQMGTHFLQETLNKQLGEHIKQKLPGIRTSLNQRAGNMRNELKILKGDETEEDKEKLIYVVIEKFKTEVRKNLEGQMKQVSIDEIKGGALINSSMYSEVYDLIDSAVAFPDEKELSRVISNLHGYRNALFIPELTFDRAVGILVEKYRTPLMEAVNVIRFILENVVNESSEKLKCYPYLQEEVLSLVTSQIQKFEEDTKLHLSIHIDAQCAFMNTRHPDFGYFNDKLEPNRLPQRIKSPDGKKMEESSDDYRKIYSGGMMLKSVGILRPKDVWLVLTPVYLICYKDKDEIDEHYRMPLMKLHCASQTDSKGTKFMFFRKDGQPLYRDQKTLELISTDPVETQSWIENFQGVGVFLYLDSGGNNTQVTERSKEQKTKRKTLLKVKPNSENSFLEDKNTVDQAQLVKKMVIKYMEIIDKTIRDITPKYIILILVEATNKYVSEHLLGDLLRGRDTKRDKENLMQASGEEERRKEELQKILMSTEEALTIVKNFYGTL